MILQQAPMWIKTTIASWVGTATGFSMSLGPFEGEIRAWAALIGGIVIPITALAFHVYVVLKKR